MLPLPTLQIVRLTKNQNYHHEAAIIKVGDTQVNVEEDRNVGSGLVIGVSTRAYIRQQLEKYKPCHIIDSLDELTAIIFPN